MTFTTEERRLLNLYHSGSANETAAVVRDALPDITEPDVHAAAVSVIRKLGVMEGTEFDSLTIESGCAYAG